MRINTRITFSLSIDKRNEDFERVKPYSAPRDKQHEDYTLKLADRTRTAKGHNIIQFVPSPLDAVVERSR